MAEPPKDSDPTTLEALVALTLQLQQVTKALKVITESLAILTASVHRIEMVQERGLQIPYLGTAKPPK